MFGIGGGNDTLGAYEEDCQPGRPAMLHIGRTKLKQAGRPEAFRAERGPEERKEDKDIPIYLYVPRARVFAARRKNFQLFR